MTQGIPAAASLALAVKLGKMFEEEDRFLTFPIGLGFPSTYFEFAKPPGATALSAVEQAALRADFARQMNLIPADSPRFAPDSGVMLWDRVREALREAVFAESALSEAEERKLAAAIDYLTDEEVGPDGVAVTVMSPQLRRYYEQRTLYEAAQGAYLDEKLSVEFASGEDGERLKRAWTEYREAQLAGVRDRAMQDWVNLGHKNAVEQHQATQAALEVRKYLEVYRQAYLSEMAISEIGDASAQGLSYLNTFFSPVDAFEPGAPWASITLTRSEMDGLIAEASPALRGMFGDPAAADPSLDAISLDYNRIVIIRPWYRGEFFASRHWRMRGDAMVCDGASPRRGPVPAVPTNVIVARNVRMVRRKEAPSQSPPTQSPPILGEIPLQVFIANKFTAIREAAPPPPPPRAPVRAAAATAVLTRPSAAVLMRAAPLAVAPAEPAVRPVQAARVASLRAARIQPETDEPAAARPVIAARSSFIRATAAGEEVVRIDPRSYGRLKLEGMTIHAPIAAEPAPPPLEDARFQPQGGGTVAETIELDGYSVLALTCKRLPRSPDPDETLRWA